MPRRDPRQQSQIGADAERHQRRDRREKRQRQRRAAAGARCETDVAQEKGKEAASPPPLAGRCRAQRGGGGHQRRRAAPCIRPLRHARSGATPASGGGYEEHRAPRPIPQHQPYTLDAQRLVRRNRNAAVERSARRSSRLRAKVLPAASSAASGSSSSQSGRRESFSRASARRFFWPAERYWQGRSATRASPTASSAAATSLSVALRHRAARRTCSVSRGLQLRLGAVVMAEPADALRALLRFVDHQIGRGQGDGARGGAQEARDHAQQRGLARAVGAFERQHLPRLDAKGQAAKQHPRPADARQPVVAVSAIARS